MLLLPSDVAELVGAHLAALVIQRRWLRWRSYAHARRGDLRAHLGDDAWRRLLRYEAVRREWRAEPESWEACTDVAAILEEAEVHGMWGRAAARLVA